MIMNTLFEVSPIPSNQLLTEKYRPLKVAGFIGLDKPKEKMAALVARPFDSAWMFVGPSGMGKTTLALAVADELNAELYHVPSQRCTIAEVEKIRSRCQYSPAFGKRLHLILVDEADTMSKAAQDAFLSILDSTNRAPNTIIIFTCNETLGLENRFLSRCFEVKFSSHAVSQQISAMLAEVWEVETNGNPSVPNFQRIVKEANNNIRAALMDLQLAIMAIA
jgi:replication-associated recombination protein RarA